MNIGEVRIAEDSDFALLKVLLTRGDGWALEYSSGMTKVWTRPAENSHFRMIRLKTVFADVTAETLYDVLHDPVFRKTWDKHMLSSSELGVLNPNNDLSYYALHCPAPLKNRDFVLQRSWLQTAQEYYIINHSVFHRDFPNKKGFVRGLSHLTGFLITPLDKGCSLGYVAHSDPGGQLPVWVTNKLSTILAPKMVKRLHKACMNYNNWKNLHNPNQKPWLYPEQISSKRIEISDCVKPSRETSGDNTPVEDESTLSENELACQLDEISLE
eukprot:GFUD01006368.1.p1 GENE.GFUD01006368.1~~GFUD01006368.1.p1  ORF type:complete len:270 (-),score=76.08 GFUD01006368.1:152-961(-)